MSRSTHTLSVLVENKPGVLARVAGLFSRRGFNIDSLAVGPTEVDDVSRMTIVVDVESHPLEQVTKQLNKLVNDAASRSHVLETAQLFRARVVDVGVEVVTIEATGTADKLDALLRVLEPFGIKEMVQSGVVAVGRGPRSITSAANLRPVERSA
jgi:acetolactate synthase-1/3 small subunit